MKKRKLLLKKKCDIKICEFGLERVEDKDNDKKGFIKEYVEKRWYRDKEIMLK